MTDTARRGCIGILRHARQGLPTITAPAKSPPIGLSGKIVKDHGNSNFVVRNGVDVTTSLSLIERVKLGESDSWGHLWYLYQPLVRFQCRRHGLSETDSEDIAQDVFKTVALKILRFEKRPGPSFRCWLRRITLNKLGDHFRRTRDQARAVGGTDAQHSIDQIAEKTGEAAMEADWDDPSDRRILLRQALRLVKSEFEPRSWRAAWRVVVEDKRPADVAAEYGMTPNAVYVAKSRILARLREILADLGESEPGTTSLAVSAPESER
jgi:RNA polymerase sigma-70 factor, ECF subfamily